MIALRSPVGCTHISLPHLPARAACVRARKRDDGPGRAVVAAPIAPIPSQSGRYQFPFMREAVTLVTVIDIDA